jgi:hypothetical protein
MLLAAGLADLGFALFHLAFWRLFGWPQRLEASGALNSAITRTLNVMLTFVFLAYGGALLWQAQSPAVPAALPLAGAAFWSLRLVLQWLWFDLRPLASRLVTGAFALAAGLHLLAALG